jgi:hypothetical protein
MPNKVALKLFKYIALLLILFSQFFSNAYSQFNSENVFDNTAPRTFHPNITKIPGHYSKKDWMRVIDTVWGEGLNNYYKAMLFGIFWSTIDSSYACFHNLGNVNNQIWSDIRLTYYPLIYQGISRGRFSGIMSYLSLMFRDIHTKAIDNEVNSTALEPGVPLFYIGGWYDNSHFGAGLTPLPDSNLLVYDVVPLHPLGLERGDIVLGYDRIPYKLLFNEILDIQMPVTGWAIGNSPSAYLHSILNAAGMNWHLFDTIDIKKFNSGDTVHLATSVLTNKSMNIFCTEQMNIPGVPKPDYPGGQRVSYGIVQGTNIGYIYCWAWSQNVFYEFYNAVKALMNTDGLILDFRFNAGGNMFLSNGGLSLLFPYNVNTICFARRSSKYDYYQMKNNSTPETYSIPGRPPGYNKPIAVLTGPGAVSSGDQVALRMKYHPNAKFFGKSTGGAFSSPTWANLWDGWFFLYSVGESYELKNPGVYLTHKELPVDYDVWLTPEYVARGKDNVVDAAMNWINSSITNIENSTSYELSQNFPNPFNARTIIKFQIQKEGFVKLIIYDIRGREVESIVNESLKPETYYRSFDGSNFSSGVYFYRIQAGDFSDTKKLILLK